MPTWGLLGEGEATHSWEVPTRVEENQLETLQVICAIVCAAGGQSGEDCRDGVCC